jgi:hypothetical protein
MNLFYRKETKSETIAMRRGSFHDESEVRPGTTIACERGMLWLTQSGDPVDHILLPNDSFVATKRGRIVIEAVREAAARINAPDQHNLHQLRSQVQGRPV